MIRNRIIEKKYFLHKKCNICGKSRNKTLYNLLGQNLLQCSSCKLLYLDRQRIDFENLYNENYFFKSESNNANYFNYDNHDQILKSNFKFAYDYIENNYNNKSYSLLDVGAGFGFFLKYLPKNIHSEAVEISKVGAEKIRNTGIKVYENNFLDAQIENKFDIIVSFDVIEHQVLLDKYLNKVNDLLKKDGVFIFTTPDFGTVFNKIFGKRSPTIQPLYHNYYFDKTWIRKMLPLFGLKCAYLKTTYITKMTINHIFLMSSFTIPSIRKIPIYKFINKFKIFNRPISFFRFGGINAIFKKTQ